jgi:hypothetical protein
MCKGETTLSREVWVNVPADLKDACEKLRYYSPETQVFRMEKILGLRPNLGKTRFAEMWVNVEDLFRPTPDPEVTDTVAQLDFAEDVSESHRAWITALRTQSYSPSSGYPWTQLGYTYDWGLPGVEIGISEYVVKSGAIVDISRVVLTADYFAEALAE